MKINNIQKLQELINDNRNFVVLTGAGVSTLSGIPDFRGANGLYKNFKNAEYYLSIDALLYDTEAFFKFYREQILLKNIKPNIVHQTIAKWEQQGLLGSVITQNIDGLHTLAGSNKVIELHGTVYKNYCIKCHKQYDLDYINRSTGVPRCSCGGVIRPYVVLYGENLHQGAYEACLNALSKTNLLIVIGTSLAVSTAAGIVNMYRGHHLVIINNEATPYDDKSTLVIRDDLRSIFQQFN